MASANGLTCERNRAACSPISRNLGGLFLSQNTALLRILGFGKALEKLEGQWRP